MNGADGVIFAGGFGENASDVRARVCGSLDWLGSEVDEARNRALAGADGRCDHAGARVALWVIPTDEGLLIGRDT